MYKTIITIISFLISVTFFTSMTEAKVKKEKKKAIVIHTPEPDPFISIHKDTKLSQSPMAYQQSKKFANSVKGGIDVSHYQGNIDWTRISKSGNISYAFVKATESNYYIDDFYNFNIEEGKKNGIAMGSYHFFRANVSMLEQFEHMTSIIEPGMQDLIPLIDVEAANGVPADVFANRLKEFLKMVEDYYGCPPILYTYVNFYNKYLAYKGFDRYPLMIAFYNEKIPSISDGHKYIMWQYTCRGRIDGIKGDVDCSKFMNGASLYDILYK